MDDDYEHPDDDNENDNVGNHPIQYILENIPFCPSNEPHINRHEYENLQELFNSVYSEKCNCTGQLCNSKDLCLHGGNYMMTTCNTHQREELILNENRPCKDLIYECSDYCDCSTQCHNRLVQYGPRKNLEIVHVVYNAVRQRGLRTNKCILKGAFICEYAGEVLTKSEANFRYKRNKEQKLMNYILCLNESSVIASAERLQTFVDPSRKGNIGRYLNHSCEPNCQILSVRVGCPVPKLAIFATRDINAFEELTFHYGGGRRENSPVVENADRIPCHCGTAECSKFLPDFSF